MPRRSAIVVGSRFGRLVVLERASSTRDGKTTWLCRCECGTTKVVRDAVLHSGTTRSCGCLARELTSARSRTHGRTNTREWLAWRGMFNRCRDRGDDHRESYWDRGIRVCNRWHDFAAFFADMGPMPSDTHTLDRIDNDRGYEPTNCRWATTAEQNRNRRCNVRLTLAGETLTAAEWARRLGMTQTGLQDRLRDGWSVERALTTKPAKRGRRAA